MIKKFLNKNGLFAKKVAACINYLYPHNKIRLQKTNTFDFGTSLLRKIKVDVQGRDNYILIKDFSRLRNCSIYIRGNNNKIVIGESCRLSRVEFYIEDNSNTISVGAHTTTSGYTHLAATEGTSIVIGEDCMFASDIQIRTGDSHSILDMNNNRINPAGDVKIGNHVWIGVKTICLKNTEIADNCVLGATSTVCGKHLKPNCVIAGNPAKIIKEDICWLRERI